MAQPIEAQPAPGVVLAITAEPQRLPPRDGGMGHNISALFDTRREAEMAIEHLVQDHGVPRQDILVTPAGTENSAGAAIGGSDAKRGPASPPADGDAALNGRIAVTLPAEDLDTDKIMAVFADFRARDVRIGRDA